MTDRDNNPVRKGDICILQETLLVTVISGPRYFKALQLECVSVKTFEGVSIGPIYSSEIQRLPRGKKQREQQILLLKLEGMR